MELTFEIGIQANLYQRNNVQGRSKILDSFKKKGGKKFVRYILANLLLLLIGVFRGNRY